MVVERVNALPLGHVPDLHSFVRGRRREALSIAGERHGEDPAGVAGESLHDIGVCDVIELHVPVVGCCEQHLRVRREAKAADRLRVALQSLHNLASLHVEDVDDAVEGSACDVLAVGAVGEAERELSVLRVQHVLRLAALHVVHRNLAVVAARNHEFVVRRERDGPQVDGAQGNLVQQPAVLCVPQAQRGIQRAARNV